MRIRLIWIAAMLALPLAAPAWADGALLKACMDKPSSLPRETCTCLDHRLRAALSADEMRIEILAFRGRFSDFRKKTAALGEANAKDFEARVASAVEACR
jgi:hypothetical protein